MRELIEQLEKINLAIFDLDGVIYRGNTLIPQTERIIRELKELSVKVVYNSNNSTATRDTYVKRLDNFNILADKSDIYTSAFITSVEITKIKRNARIFVIGEIGLREELKNKGHMILKNDANHKNVDFVIVGLDRRFNYQDLAFAQKSILDGSAQFYATNIDATLPDSNGFLPGAGTMVKALEVCTSQKPIKIFGKPSPLGIESIIKNFNGSSDTTAIFGDRLDTDIRAGNLAGITTVLVLTGVSSRKDVEEIKRNQIKNYKELIPDVIIDGLSSIFR